VGAVLTRTALASLVALALLAAPAAAEPDLTRYRTDLAGGDRPAPPDAIPVRPSAPPPPSASGHSPDLGVHPGPAERVAARRARARAAKEQAFVDQHGHTILVATDDDRIDLRPFAQILAATYHSGEIERLATIVTSSAGVARICGSSLAVACYITDRSGSGTMVVSHQDDDITHTMFHEYGHHMDNQLYNLSAQTNCRFGNDGSRRWFFARDVEDRILNRTTCDPDANWASLLGELYAEDYAQLSAARSGVPISGFDRRMPVPPPSPSVLAAMQRDIDRPFVPRARTLKGSFRDGRARRRLRLDVPSFLRLGSASEIRRARVSGCATPYTGVFRGRCALTLTRKGGARRYRIRVLIF
jgi:hypothetical protein